MPAPPVQGAACRNVTLHPRSRPHSVCSARCKYVEEDLKLGASTFPCKTLIDACLTTWTAREGLRELICCGGCYWAHRTNGMDTLHIS